MKKMSKNEYREILGKLPILNPTDDDMAMVCPHLTKEQAVAAFNNQDSGYVACPPLRINYAFQIVSLWKGDNGKPIRLDWSYASRTPQSYADGRRHGDIFHEYQYMAEAIKYAQENWGNELILDTWVDAQEIYIQDPSDLVHKGCRDRQPKTVTILYVTLNRGLNDIINDHSKPVSESFDDAIAEMTVDFKIWHELMGGRGVYTDFNCAYCGSGLGLAGCSGCGHTFDDDHFRCGWNTPLSRKMVEFLQQNGLIFKKDPQIAWDTEKEYFEKFKKMIAERKEIEKLCGAAEPE